MRALIAGVCLVLAGAGALAEESALKELTTADATRGWEAVGRIDIAGAAFCTGSLIAPTLVLTAAHCLFNKETSAAFSAPDFKFLAGWRNGRAVAYRGVKRIFAHPDYIYEGPDKIDRVSYDLALLELDQPIRLPSMKPYPTGADPVVGDAVGIVSYAFDRSEAPSLQETCHVLERDPTILILSCSVDFGSSGAPIFALRDGAAPEIVSVVSAKAQMGKSSVALGTAMSKPLGELLAAFSATEPGLPRALPRVGDLTSGTPGAKFVRP